MLHLVREGYRSEQEYKKKINEQSEEIRKLNEEIIKLRQYLSHIECILNKKIICDMNKNKEKVNELFHFQFCYDGVPPVRKRISGPNPILKGDTSKIYGDCSNIHGYLSDICGDVSGIKGDATKLKGDVTHLKGDIIHLDYSFKINY